MLVALGLNAAQLEPRLDARPMVDREFGPVAPITGRLMLTELMPDGVSAILCSGAIVRQQFTLQTARTSFG